MRELPGEDKAVVAVQDFEVCGLTVSKVSLLNAVILVSAVPNTISSLPDNANQPLRPHCLMHAAAIQPVSVMHLRESLCCQLLCTEVTSSGSSVGFSLLHAAGA